MKYGLTVFVAMIVIGGAILASGYLKAPPPPDGTELKWNSYSEAIALGKEQNKKVLVDVYTTWCGWCKKMDKDIYGNADVKKYLENNFVLAKLNAESLKQHKLDSVTVTEAQIAKAYGITGYPTTLFLTSEGKAITVVPGYIQLASFKSMLKYIKEDVFKTTKWEEFLKQDQKN